MFRRSKTCCRNKCAVSGDIVICITGDLSLDERKKFRLSPAMVLGWLQAAALQWASHVLGAA